MKYDKIAVVDFGGQYTHLIASKIRRLNVLSEIREPDEPLLAFQEYKGIILSGSPSLSSFDEDSGYTRELFELPIPILGLCFGHQEMAKYYAGKVEHTKKEYGYAELHIVEPSPVFEGLGPREQVWLSHGDTVTVLPPGFRELGYTTLEADEQEHRNAAIACHEKKRYGLQFHPEVDDTPNGEKILANFVLNICGCRPDWTVSNYMENKLEEIQKHAGDRKVFLLVSGGVDSTVCARLIGRAVGEDRLFCLHIDNGLMRKNESRRVIEAFTPVLSDISPDSGSIQGGFNVTITGSNFNYGVTSVLFGSNSATGITIEDGNLLTCLTPRGDSVGFVDVTITSLFGSDVLLNGYEYLPSPPLIYSVNPSRGYVGSETPVTINGDFFTTTADTQVLFGSQNASGVEVVDTSTITCLTPIATEHGYVDVTVINSNGSGTLENGFRYSLHPPKIYAVDPDTGPGCGGNLVTVIGDYFTDFTTVFFSWLVASDITCIDPNTLTCRPPAGKGTVDVIVAHDLGEFDTLPSAYTYISVEVFAVEPDYGHVLGGDIITITGTNFTTSEDTNVKFGALNAPWVNVINSTKMEVQTPPRNPGKVNVTVINSYGIALLENGFEYLNRPLLYFLGGDVMAGSPVAFKIRAPNRPYENLCLLANNQLGPTHFPGMGITLDLALEGILVKYNSFGGGSALDLNGQGERTCLVNIPDYPPGLIYWQAIVGKLSPISLEVSNRVDLEILE